MFQKYFRYIRVLLKMVLCLKCVKYYNFIKSVKLLHIWNDLSIFLLQLKCFFMVADKILIVDDEETLCEVLKLNLENEGYDVDVAYSAEEALAMDLKVYSLILLDIMMGGISGI